MATEEITLRSFIGTNSPIYVIDSKDMPNAGEIYPSAIVENMSYVDCDRVDSSQLTLAFKTLKTKIFANDITEEGASEAMQEFTTSVNEFVESRKETDKEQTFIIGGGSGLIEGEDNF